MSKTEQIQGAIAKINPRVPFTIRDVQRGVIDEHDLPTFNSHVGSTLAKMNCVEAKGLNTSAAMIYERVEPKSTDCQGCFFNPQQDRKNCPLSPLSQRKQPRIVITRMENAQLDCLNLEEWALLGLDAFAPGETLTSAQLSNVAVKNGHEYPMLVRQHITKNPGQRVLKPAKCVEPTNSRIGAKIEYVRTFSPQGPNDANCSECPFHPNGSDENNYNKSRCPLVTQRS